MPYKDPQQRKDHARAYHHAHREQANEERRRRHLAHRDEELATQKAWRDMNSERKRAATAAWSKANPEKCRASGKRHRDAVRAAMIEAYGGRCACCGETTPAFLTLDHANGGGNEHRRRYNQRSNQGVVRELRNAGWPQDGYRLLCWNCQHGVQLPGGCPHQALI